MVSQATVAFSIIIFLSISWPKCAANAVHDEFIHCISTIFHYPKTMAEEIHTQSSPSYTTLLESAEQNPRWYNNASTSLKPLAILTPNDALEIQAAIICSQRSGLRVRVKSGGHDYEGLSFRSPTPFIVIDLINYRRISIDLDHETAWVQSGATLGELYFAISQKSRLHGFPAGLCPSVGIGGHLSGGGIGTMIRKHGLAADNVIDAMIINADGVALDRKAMGEDLFWAIRGGGGASFGVILSWKIKLVRVPENVTVFTLQKKLDYGQEGTKLVHLWQNIAPNLPYDLFLRVIIQNGDKEAKGSVVALFNSLFLGPKHKLITIMNKRFPELGLKTEDCKELTWIESAQYFAGFTGRVDVLLNRTVQYKSKFKGKTDFVVEPIPERALNAIWKRFPEEQFVYMIMDPFGGKMDEIPESEIPFPHRKGNLFNIQYLVKWEENEGVHLKWIADLFEYMRPYVSKSPRGGYINYRDLDLGMNLQGSAPRYAQAKLWGEKYFKNNFKKLARVKREVDPNNFFTSEQSIPHL